MCRGKDSMYNIWHYPNIMQPLGILKYMAADKGGKLHINTVNNIATLF